MKVYPDMDFYTLNGNNRKITVQKLPKTQKNNNLLKTKNVLNTEI